MALVKLSAEQLARIDLPEELREAVLEARRFTKHEAIRRQMQYIGRIMRDVDVAPDRRAARRDARALEDARPRSSTWPRSGATDLLADPRAIGALRARVSRRRPAATAHARRRRARRARRPSAAEALPRALPRDQRHPAGPRQATSRERTNRSRIGLVSTSDRASQGVYKDEGIPALEEWLACALLNPDRASSAA